MEFSFVKIAVFVPVTHSGVVRECLAEAGAGKIGDYDFCSFSVRGTGRFRPLKGAQPFIGTEGEIEAVDEEKIEVICPIDIYTQVIEKMKKVHPYEMPAYDVYPLLNQA